MAEKDKKPKAGSPAVKALKAVNFISGNNLSENELKKHRRLAEWAGNLATPKTDIDITPFKAGRVRCEAIKPVFACNPEYCILYAHGGGYVSGGLHYSRVLAAKLAMATGFTTCSFAYRLAPEHPYPAALNDMTEVWEHLTSRAYDAGRILLSGDSAGGNLVLCFVRKLIAEKKPLPRQLLLFSPWTDMTGTAASYELNRNIDPILKEEYVMASAKAYIGEGDPHDPAYSPLFGDLHGYPPVYIMAGRNGILLDDSIRLEEKIREDGGKVILDIEDKGWHVYQQMPIPMARQAMRRLSEQVSREIYGNSKEFK